MYFYYHDFISLFTPFSYLSWSLTFMTVLLYLFNTKIIMYNIFISSYQGLSHIRMVFFLCICVVNSSRIPAIVYSRKWGVIAYHRRKSSAGRRFELSVSCWRIHGHAVVTGESRLFLQRHRRTVISTVYRLVWVAESDTSCCIFFKSSRLAKTNDLDLLILWLLLQAEKHLMELLTGVLEPEFNNQHPLWRGRGRVGVFIVMDMDVG